MEMNSGSMNFIIWMANNTNSIQSNVRTYKKVFYFIDKKTHTCEGEGGIKELWDVYVNEMLG